MMNDRTIKVRNVLIVIVYCVLAALTVATLTISLLGSPVGFGIINQTQNPILQVAWVAIIPLGGAMPISTLSLRIAYRQKFQKKILRKLLIYIPWALLLAEFALFGVFFVYAGYILWMPGW